MPLPTTYATADKLEAYWQPLSAAEKSRATVLLGYAATMINEQPGAADADGNLAFSPATCEHVSLDMVKRAMIGGGGMTGSSSSQSMADMSASTDVRYVNPVGNLYLTSQELARLQGHSYGGGAASITLSSNVRVPGQPWNYQQSSQTDGTA
ncbi:hypothetical protein A5722_05130 [Mycobacterium vulneris]|nr:hypothetical protein A5722_05130 [Mycolicibacterium vulneris]OCB61500.1 hypothetical protein A5729_03805 [Mycolicibacterium vulneris]